MGVIALEKDIEDFLYESSRRDGRFEHYDLCLDGRCFRQVNLGSYGIIDLLFVDLDCCENTLLIDIVELKKEKLNLDAVGQTIRYKRGMERFLDVFMKRIKMFRRTNYKITCHLIGKEFVNDDSCFVADALEDFYIYFYDIDLEKGIHFWEKSGWANQKENFRSISKILRKINHTHKKQLSDYYKYLLESHTR